MSTPLGARLWKGAEVDTLTETGTFRAYLSTWDTDLENERFEKGAFIESIFDYYAAGVMPALLWQHDRSPAGRGRAFDTTNVVGRLMTMKEDNKGLLVTGRIDLGSDGGRLVYEALRKGLLSMSVGFVALRWHHEGGTRVFEKAEILEATLTDQPANPEARVLEVKHQPRQEKALERVLAHVLADRVIEKGARRIAFTSAAPAAGPAPAIRPDMTPDDVVAEEPTVLQTGRIRVWEVDDGSRTFRIDP